MLLALLLAAQVTQVADAADEKHPLEIDLEVSFSHSRRETRITRENSAVDELHHLSTVDEVVPRLTFGLYHDLELHLYAPFVIREVQDFRLYDPARSTLANNTIEPSGCARVGACVTVSPIVLAPGESRRQGFRDPTVGIAWSPINEDRELQLKPSLFPDGHALATWAVGFDYTMPLPGPVDDPSRLGRATAFSLGGPPADNVESRKAHVFSLWTAWSKRFRVAEPYLRLTASLPFAMRSKAYDNCAHPELLTDVAAANCAAEWKGLTGYKPPIEGILTFGSELVVRRSPQREDRLAFDVRGEARYHGPGRDYTQVTDALGKLTYAGEYATFTGAAGFTAEVGGWLRGKVYGFAGFDTPHFLTAEDVGDEKDAVPGIQLSGGSGRPAPDQNPNYDFRLDQVGKRLHAEAAFLWGLSASLTIVF